jgi:hypothetical protein
MKKKVNVLKTESDKRRKLQKINNGIKTSQDKLLAGDVVQNSIKNTIEGPKKKIKVEKTINPNRIYLFY